MTYWIQCIKAAYFIFKTMLPGLDITYGTIKLRQFKNAPPRMQLEIDDLEKNDFQNRANFNEGNMPNHDLLYALECSVFLLIILLVEKYLSTFYIPSYISKAPRGRPAIVRLYADL